MDAVHVQARETRCPHRGHIPLVPGLLWAWEKETLLHDVTQHQEPLLVTQAICLQHFQDEPCSNKAEGAVMCRCRCHYGLDACAPAAINIW